MARSRIWTMSAGESLVLAVSLESDLETDATLDGTPEVSVWQRVSGSTFVDVTDAFEVAEAQVNVSPFTPAGGGAVAAGKGIVYQLTASETAGSYEVRAECDATDGTHPVTVRTLVVTGPGSPA